jgi:hypothetical protein
MKKAYLKRLILAIGLSLLGQLSISKAATNIFAQPGQEAPGTFFVGAEAEIAGLNYIPGNIWKRDSFFPRSDSY